jgi:signal peptidase II
MVAALFWGIALGVLLLDQLTKWIFYQSVWLPVELIPGILRFSEVHNTGAAFGLFGNGTVFLTIISILVCGYIAVTYKDYLSDKPTLVSISLILGGAAGNLIDRVLRGFVIDFIEIVYWPTFNIADSAITIGGIILAYLLLTGKLK